MNFRKKTSNITKALYIILSLCIVSIIALSLYSALNKEEENFNSNNNSLGLQNNNNADLNNNLDGANSNLSQEEAEDALANMFKKQTETTQAQTNINQTTGYTTPPATKAPPKITQAQTQAPLNNQTPTNEYVPAIQPEEEITDSAPANANTPDEAEPALEVMSTPNTFIKPLNGYVSKRHNPDTPEYSVAMNDYRTHAGIDIDGEVGANIKAIADGTIESVYEDPLMGTTVVIAHSDGLKSIYMNLQSSLPKTIVEGAAIKGGEVVGGVGESALVEMTDVPHLHFEMTRDGAYIDPFEIINFG